MKRFCQIALYVWLAAAVASPFFSASRAGTSLVRISMKHRPDLRLLNRYNIEYVASVKGGYIDVLADDEGLAFLQRQPYPVSVMWAEGMQSMTTQLDADLGDYHTYAEMDSVLTYYASTYPTIADKFSVGTSSR